MPEIECPSCQQVIQDTDTFCIKCGVAIVPRCVGCGAEVRNGASFCYSCGGNVTNQLPAQEHEEKILWESLPESEPRPEIEESPAEDNIEADNSEPDSSIPTQSEISHEVQNTKPFVDSHMPLAVLSIFLFWLTGFIAVYFAVQTNVRLKQGDYEGALGSSDKALTAIKCTFGACAITLLVFLVILLGITIES